MKVQDLKESCLKLDVKDALKALREAKKLPGYVAPTAAEKRAAANLKAKARRAAKKAAMQVL